MASPTRPISIVVVCQHVQYQRYPDRHRRVHSEAKVTHLRNSLVGSPLAPRKTLGVRWPRRCTTTEGPGLLAGVSDSAARKRGAAQPADRTLGHALVATKGLAAPERRTPQNRGETTTEATPPLDTPAREFAGNGGFKGGLLAPPH